MGYRLKKIIAWIGIGLVAFIAVGLVIRAVFNYTNGKKLEKFLGQMKSEGIPLTLKDIEPECNPRENAALIWKTAEAMFSIDRENRTFLGKIIEGFFADKPISEEEKQRLHDLIAENQDIIRLILEASTKPCFKYEEQWEIPRYNLKTASVINIIQGTRLLGIDAVIKAEDGRVEEAIDQCLAARRFLQLYLQEPFLISYLVATACMKQVAVCFNKIVAERKIETDMLKKILKEWNCSPWQGGLVRSFESERIYGLEAVLLHLKGEYEMNLGLGGKLFYWVFRPVYKSEIIWLMGHYDCMQKAAGMHYYASRDSRELEQRMKSTPWYYKMAGLFLPNAVTVLFKRATLEAMFDTARVGIACKIYKNIHGDFPEDLAELAPEILGEVPVDPFTGNHLTYKKQDSGIIVYSIGSNLKDDGGNGTWQITSIVMEKPDDWAWKEVIKK
ncbi:MAG: hypothetical protein OEW69_03655 [Nitrospirota bacterium]|nr:hypothetical protein [Nitrospirota bacterium]MDH5744919.1 hypothetical protein [Candidatus Aminicenantes bacterium]